jgi:hypothetical protein
MFTSPRANFYESSDGFSVELLGRTGFRYREAGRQMFVDSEVLTEVSGMAVYRYLGVSTLCGRIPDYSLLMDYMHFL